MITKIDKNAVRQRRHARVRKTVTGTAETPRMNVYRSLNHIYVQVIDDRAGDAKGGVTLASASTMDKEVKEKPHYLGHRMRLRERFLKDEGKSMADYELLELLLTIAIPRRDVKQKAKDLLNHFGSFNKVITASQNSLSSYGLSENVITILKVIRASAIKLSWQELNEQNEPILSNFDYMIDYCRTAMSYLDVEEFRVIFLDAKLKIIKEETKKEETTEDMAIMTLKKLAKMQNH